MKIHLLILIILCICSTQTFHSQEEDGVVSLTIPSRNSLTFNRYIINPTFSFVREQTKYISIYNKREWVQFEDAPLTYLVGYSGRFDENIGAGIGLFQQNYGVLTTFGGILNFAYNAKLGRDSNLTFGLNIGAYKSGINTSNVVTNFTDPALQNVPENFLLTINPGLNYGTEFLDFGVSVNNLALYNFQSSELIQDNPQQSLQAHLMYTGYMDSRGFFDESKFSGLIRSDFQNDETIISGLAMITVPKGIWAQVGYNTLYGASGGLGVNLTTQIAIEYNFETAMGDLQTFGPSHEFTLAYRFKNRKYYDYSREDEVVGLISGGNKKRYVSNNKSKPTEASIKAAQDAKARREAAIAAKKVAQQSAKEDAKKKAQLLEDKKAEEQAEAKLLAEEKAKIDAKEKEEAKLIAEQKAEEIAETRAKILAEQNAKKEAEAKAKLIAEQKAQQEADAQAKLLAEQKAKEEAAAKLIEEQKAAALIAQQKAKEEAEAKAQLIAEQKAQQEADAQAKLLAEQKAKEEAAAKLIEEQKAAELIAQQKAKEEAEAKAQLIAEQKAQQEADAQAKIVAEQKAKEEAAAKLIEEQKAAELIAQQKAKEEAEAKAQLIAEQKAQQEADAQAKLLAEQKAKEEAAAKLVEEEKAKEDLISNPQDDLGKEMQALAEKAENSKETQNRLLKEFDDMVAVKDKDLKDLKEENDLSDQGITVKPRPFKSVTAENNKLNGIKSDLDDIIKARTEEIEQLRLLYEQRSKVENTELDEVNLFFKKKIKRLTEEQVRAVEARAKLDSSLETIRIATEFEKRRRIKRAAYDNEEDRYSQDRAALKNIRQTTPLSSKPLKAEDFDFGEDQGNSIKILKNVSNIETGYYVVIAVHSDVKKRNDFLTKVVASGNKNVDFFYDVSTSEYYIYYEKFDSINNANEALKSKGDQPYNTKMSLIKIEN